MSDEQMAALYFITRSLIPEVVLPVLRKLT